MAPFIVLCAVTIGARLAGALGVGGAGSWPDATAVGLGAMFFLTGISHFVPGRREGLVAIVPPALGHPAALVTLTGVLEVLGAGVLVTSPHGSELRMVTAWALAALLVAMFPANVRAARERQHSQAPHTPLGRRALMQAVFLAAALLVAVAG